MKDILVGRQPIYGRTLNVCAYELLFRGEGLDLSQSEDGDRATSEVILNAVSEIGLDRVVGERLAFLNLTRSFIVGDYPLPVPPERVVLEVLEDVMAEPRVLEGLRRLRGQGFRIALDDFVFTEQTRPLLEFADIVKVDLLHADEAEVRRQVELLRPYRVELLAEKIETQEMCDLCRDVGFQYFQGFFLAKPRIVKGRSIAPAHVNLLRLLAELQQPDFEFERAQELVSKDVGISLRLLRHMNSALYGMPRKIDSVHETLVYLGLDNVKNLTALLLLSSVGGKPQDLLATSMQRAKTCELVAVRQGVADSSRYFTVGLFSTLDALLDVSMESVLSRLPLSEDLHDALLDHAGPLGSALNVALALERADWEGATASGLTLEAAQECLLEALDWVRGVECDLVAMAA